MHAAHKFSYEQRVLPTPPSPPPPFGSGVGTIRECDRNLVTETQFYISCAQIRVTSNGTGTLGPLVNFPGAYTSITPGVLIPDFWTYIRNYTVLGPALWPAGTKISHVVRTYLPLEDVEVGE